MENLNLIVITMVREVITAIVVVKILIVIVNINIVKMIMMMTIKIIVIKKFFGNNDNDKSHDTK